MSSRNLRYPLLKYVDMQKPPKGSGGTATTKCNLCKLEWKGSYTQVKAHFMKIPRKGVDPCTGDPDDANRLHSAQIEQQKADGKAISQSCHNVDHDVNEDDESNEKELPSDDVVQFGNEHIPSRASTSTASDAHKKPKVGGLYDMSDVKGREGVDLAIARFFFACGIPFNAACSPYFEQMVRAIKDGPRGYKAPGYEKLRTVLVDQEACLEKKMAPLKVSWSGDGFSIVMDGFSDCRNCPLININVSSITKATSESKNERLEPEEPEDSSITKSTSESKSEHAEPEELEVVVKTLVDKLGPGNSKRSQTKAAKKLRLLAKHKKENRMKIAKAGAVRPLVCLLRSADPQTQEAAVTALLNLSLHDDNKMEITRAGAIEPLIDVLKKGTSVAKQNAACALSSLASIDDNKVSIGAAGAILPLVDLLISGSSRGKKDAATALYTLSSFHQNKDRAIRAGAINPLVDLMADPSSDMVDKAVVVLSKLASVPDGKNAIVEEGGIPVLVKMIDIGSPMGREFATITLIHLCKDSYPYRTLVSREGAIPPLVALSQSDTARAKLKAATLLQYLREPQKESL